MATGGLTPKQTQVKHLMDADMTIPQIAKRLKITPSAVHGHVRRIKIRLAEGDVAKPETPAEPVAPTPPPVTSTSNGHHDDVEAVVRGALNEAAARYDSLSDQIDKHEAEITALRNEQVEIDARRERYGRALEVLA